MKPGDLLLALLANTAWAFNFIAGKAGVTHFQPFLFTSLRFAILKRDGYRCQICGRDAHNHGVVLEVDHRTPRAKGGSNEPSNLWTLCFDCNQGKSDTDL